MAAITVIDLGSSELVVAAASDFLGLAGQATAARIRR
jgi:hypothetical protein